MFGHSKADVLSKNKAGDFAFLQVRADGILGEMPTYNEDRDMYPFQH